MIITCRVPSHTTGAKVFNWGPQTGGLESPQIGGFLGRKTSVQCFFPLCTPQKAICSASINGIWQCGLGGQKLYNGKKRDLLSRMRPKCGPNLELLQTPSCYFHKNAMKSLKSTFCDKSAMLFIIEGMLYKPISQYMHALIIVLTLIDILSPFFTASLPLVFHAL